MSLTIAPNDLKFVIFASGHDYTLADSGDGDVQVFSHPFVPLNSVMYAGQWYFLVPDENGEPMDAVKDDLAHCTFTPALGDAFSTEGEVTVECHYHREYIYPEDTLVVDKTVSQKITVVNHGTVQQSNTYCDLYSDGYLFYRPRNTSSVENGITLEGTGQPNKISSLPWRVANLGRGIYEFCNAWNLSDISELQYADTSHVVGMYRVFPSARYLTVDKLTEAIGNWNVDSLQYIDWLVQYALGITDLSFLSKCNAPHLTTLNSAFYQMQDLRSLHGLENWRFDEVTSLYQTFSEDFALTDISALTGKNVENVTTIERAFTNDKVLSDLSPLATWSPVSLEEMSYTFENCEAVQNYNALANWRPHLTGIRECFKNNFSLVNIEGLANLDVSGVTLFYEVFSGDSALRSLHGLESWDVSNGQSFERCFSDLQYISSLTPIANWNFASATNVTGMWASNGFITNVDNVNWNFPNVTNNQNAGIFSATHKMWYSSLIGKNIFETWWYYYDYEGNAYGGSAVYDDQHPLVQVWKDASNAGNWTVGGSNLEMFGTTAWNNVPSWN